MNALGITVTAALMAGVFYVGYIGYQETIAHLGSGRYGDYFWPSLILAAAAAIVGLFGFVVIGNELRD